MAYATTRDVAKGFRELSVEEELKCEALLEEADVLIDVSATTASDSVKKVVECRMVRRALGDGTTGGLQFPLGSTQGSASALGYTQSWTMGNGSSGELYIGKTEKKMLGLGNKIGFSNPFMEDDDD